MTPGAFVGAILVALATTMPSHARVEVMGGGPSHRGVSNRPAESTALPDDSANNSNSSKTEAAAIPEGAIYNPFVKASESGSPHEATEQQSSNADNASVSLTFVVALAGVAVFGYVVRRAMVTD